MRPEGFGAGFGFGGDGENLVDLVLALEGRERFGERVVGEAVGFSGDDEVGTLGVTEEVDELTVAGLWRDVAVYQTDGEGEGLALGEVGFDEVGPLGGDGFGYLGVAVAGQVGEDERGSGFDFVARALVQREEVDGTGAAGGG